MSAWILLRGLTREARHWGPFPQLLRRELAGLRDAPDAPADVALLELAGNGSANAVPAPPDVGRMMALLRAEAAARGLGAPYRLLGMSLGGMVAAAWAQRHPAEIERLVLVNTSMRPFCGVAQRLRPAAWPAVLQLAACRPAPEKSERIIHELTCNRRDSVAADIAAWTDIRRSAPVSAANGLRQLWAAARFRAERSAPHCPTLLLSSAADRLVDPACSARIAARWSAAHAIHPWAGHDLPHDDPQWTAAAIRDWLRAVEGAAGPDGLRRGLDHVDFRQQPHDAGP
jgi:pimeloyl-ACP methyl ester carboxylesterase